MQTSGKRGGKPKDFRTAPPGEAAWAEVRSAAGAVADADGRGGGGSPHVAAGRRGEHRKSASRPTGGSGWRCDDGGRPTEGRDGRRRESEHLLVLLGLHDGVDDGHGRDVDHVADGAAEVREVDGLVQSHLYRADEFGVHIHRLQ